MFQFYISTVGSKSDVIRIFILP